MSDLPNKKWKVYKDPLMPKNKFLMGYQGKSQLGTGYVLSADSIPLMPALPVPTVIERLAGVVDDEVQERVEKMDANLAWPPETEFEREM